MRKLRALWIRLFHARRTKREFAVELESHLAMHIEEGLRAGLTGQEARRQALIALGGVEQTRQAYRERAALPMLETLLQDIRYALRGFQRNPIFSLTAIATLALGIGATTAVFSVVDRILFRSLPYAHDDRLVSFGLSQSLERQEFTLGGFFYEWRDNQKPFASVTFERGVGECNLVEQNPVQLRCARVAANFLSTLGISPILGRNFLPEEDVPGGAMVALISDGLWLSRYNRDPGVLNRDINVDGHATRIVGVLPRNFEMPRLQETDILVPAQMDIAAQHTVNAGIGYPMWAFARLKPGVSIAEARVEIDPLFRHTQAWIPAQFRNEFHLQVRSVRDRQMQDAYTAAWVLLGAVIAVLLIACANVAALFSARGVAREKEFAVRSALGASRTRLVRQSMTEACLLAMMGGIAGCGLAAVLLRLFIAIAPTGIPLIANARLDLRIIGFAGCVALGSAIIFGIMPALQQPAALRVMSRFHAARLHTRLRRALVALQIGISVVLLSGAMLLVKSFRSLESQNLGMQTRNVLVVRTPLAGARYPDAHAYMDFYLRAEDAMRRVPGVTAVALSDSLPPDANSWHNGMRYPDLIVPGRPPTPPEVGGTVITRQVTPDYFKVLHIPLVQGVGFGEEDRNTRASSMVLSRELARRLFPNEDAVGKHVQIADYRPYRVLNGPTYTVVGVAGDVKNAGLSGPDDPEFYTLRRNHPEDWSGHAVILLETELPPSTVEPWVRAQIAQLDRTAPAEMERLAQTVSKLADRPRFETALLSFFALTGLVMAVIGLYGVIAYMAVQRTQEIGVHMALGAGRTDILRLILGEAMRLVMLGGVAGLIAALGLSRVLKSLLFHVEPYDPTSYVSVAFLLGLVALAAALIPARSAMKTDPIAALRVE
jgi:predicted permease